MKDPLHIVDSNLINIADAIVASQFEVQLSLAPESRDKVAKCRAYLDDRLSRREDLLYGINTGFGSLCNVKVEKHEYSDHQKNLVVSHACGLGDTIPVHIARLIFYLKIKNLGFGYSGARISLVDHMISIYNKGVTPVIYEFGSLGASGDLAPLAHLGLTLLGMGSSTHNGKVDRTDTIFDALSLKGIDLSAKEGLALLNGTQFSLAYATWSTHEAQKMLKVANMIAAMSARAFECGQEPYHHLIHQIRPHAGQIAVAKSMKEWLGPELKNKKSVQDPYSFRCVPQVHGATSNALDHVIQVVETELNSTTDNPNIFPEADQVLTGGNFHAQPLALVLDYLAIALAELGNISERRTYQLINGDRELPPFLIANAGKNSGFMIAQYAAASVVSKNKQLCTPASVDSIVSSKGQEDHVSMAANAATRTYKLVNNVWMVLGVEFLIACQAIDFRNDVDPDSRLASMHQAFRKEVTHMSEDRELHLDMKAAEKFIRNLDDTLL